MAASALSIGCHFSPSYHYKRSLQTASAYSLPTFSSSLCRIRGPRLLRNGVLAGAEDKARGGSSPTPPNQQEVQPHNEKKLEVFVPIPL